MKKQLTLAPWIYLFKFQLTLSIFVLSWQTMNSFNIKSSLSNLIARQFEKRKFLKIVFCLHFGLTEGVWI